MNALREYCKSQRTRSKLKELKISYAMGYELDEDSVLNWNAKDLKDLDTYSQEHPEINLG